MNYHPWLRVRSWNNGVRCMSFCILILLVNRLTAMWKSSCPASFSPAGLTLWWNWLERWLATLSGLSTQVRIPVGLLVPGRYKQLPIKSKKTTSMEDVSTGVLEKIKNIQEVKIKPKNDMMYQNIYNCICQNTKKWRYTIQYVKPTAQLLFKNRFPKRWTNMQEASG